ncbi:EAL domain-containing protein [Bacillus dakarensis]|uniref:EAL domain-containing protein n=1 Tax=Robertmurraya dakarensis TaxID=1926278 RepID=UPI000980B680|nr:EAL domain-containing protein [Bacillus dakarensis]
MNINFINQVRYERVEHAYQPLWQLHNWKVYGYEALLRFTEGAQNQNIEAIFDEARREGSLYELDTLSISKAISSFPFEQSLSELLFINIFPSTLLNDQFESFIEQLLIQYPQAIGRIVFELNETKNEEHIWRIQELKEKIKFLKEKNFIIALDDIGKGAAGLQKIVEFSPDIIKVDQYFSRELFTSKDKQQLLSLLVQYSKQRMILILEGLEQEMDLAIAKTLQVPVAQGYLLGKPEKIKDGNLFSELRSL